MALKFLDGFDHYSYSELPKKWNYSSWGNAALNTNFLTTGRYSGQCLFTSSYYLTNFWKNFDNQATWIVGFAYKATNSTGNHTTLSLIDTVGNSTQCYLQIYYGMPVLYRGNNSVLATAGKSVIPGVWNYIELKVTIGASGSAELRINGDTYFSVSGVATQNSSNAYANQINFNANTTPAIYYDDIYICDNTTALNNDFLGDMRIVALMPSGSGTNTNWTPSTGSNYTCVNETLVNNDTNYISTSVASTIDTYAITSLSSSSATIKGLQTVLVARKEDAGFRQISSVIRSGGSNYTGTATALSDGYSVTSDIWSTDPSTSVAWTPAGVNNMEVGVQLTT